MQSVNPNRLTAPVLSHPSPSASSDSSSRKRPRTSDYQTSEERREARAERNRIAAQISRDRRKAEFEELKHKVTFLERENTSLRANLMTMGSSPSQPAVSSTAPVSAPSALSQTITNEQFEERERENKELRERVKMLEKTLESVVSALQGVGGSLGVGLSVPPMLTTPPPSTSSSSSSTGTSSTAFAGVASPTASVSTSSSSLESARHLAAGGSTNDRSIDEIALFDASTLPTNATTFTATALESGSSTTNGSPLSTTNSHSEEQWLASVFEAVPNATASPASTDYSSILKTPTLETDVSLEALMSSMTDSTTLFNEAEKFVSLLPPSVVDTQAVTSSTKEDWWMSNWLADDALSVKKEEVSVSF